MVKHIDIHSRTHTHAHIHTCTYIHILNHAQAPNTMHAEIFYAMKKENINPCLVLKVYTIKTLVHSHIILNRRI